MFDTLHAALRAALDDLRALEDDKRYEIDMSNWHAYYSNQEVCHVCLAGAVMARTLEHPPTDSLCPVDFGRKLCDQLMALDRARQGEWAEALTVFYDTRMVAPLDLPYVPPYRKDRDGFVNALERAIQTLKGYDL